MRHCRYNFRLLLQFVLVTLCYALSGSVASGEEIWLAPQASVPPSPLARAVDFLDMFKPDAPWQRAAARTQVFALYGSFLSHAPQEQIDTIVKDLSRRGMAIALEVGVINVGPISTHPVCGGLGLIEGYGTTSLAKNISNKILHAGGSLQYLTMDEPLWYGHYFERYPRGEPSTQLGCQSSVGEIVSLSVPTIDVYRQNFPNVHVGVVEPTFLARQPDWQKELSDWLKAFRGATGQPLAFFHLDVPWHFAISGGGSDNIADAASVYHYLQQLQRDGLVEKLGVIYNGAKDDTTDKAWMDAARAHIRILEKQYGVRPQQVVIQSWSPNPTHAMPDSSPNALTSLVNYYLDVEK